MLINLLVTSALAGWICIDNGQGEVFAALSSEESHTFEDPYGGPQRAELLFLRKATGELSLGIMLNYAPLTCVENCSYKAYTHSFPQEVVRQRIRPSVFFGTGSVGCLSECNSDQRSYVLRRPSALTPNDPIFLFDKDSVYTETLLQGVIGKKPIKIRLALPLMAKRLLLSGENKHWASTTYFKFDIKEPLHPSVKEGRCTDDFGE